jgi:hypothetical protein
MGHPRTAVRVLWYDGIVKLLGMLWSPGNSRHCPEAIATDLTLRPPAPSL